MVQGKSGLPNRKYLHTAYLLSRYPAVSHTFFLHEIQGMEQNHLRIETASINVPDRPEEMLSPLEKNASEKTFYLKKQSVPKALSTIIRTAFTRPGVLIRGFRAALLLEPWHLSHTLYAMFYVVEGILLGDWMQRRGLKHLHIHFSGAVATVGMITSLIWGFPYSITIHGPDEFFDQKESALAQKIHCAKFIICISDFSRSQIMRLTPPTNWNKFHIVRLGINPVLAENPLPELHSGNLRLLCTGRLVGAKGQAVLLLAVTELLRRGHSLQLTLIGDGPHRAELEQLAEDKNLGTNVTFAGAQNHDRVLETLRSTDIFVLPSFAEGVPVALMEAMAIGVPCISTFVAGIPELIRHEQDGLLVPAGSVSELTNAIERLITDSAGRDRLRRSARQRVLEHYNLPVNLQLLAETFALYLPAESSSA